MAIPANDNQLWKGFNGHGLYAKRAEQDRNGDDIVSTYAKKSDVPALTNELNTSSTTAVTPNAVKESIDAIVKIPDTANQPSTLYVGGQGMGWTGWDSEEIDVPSTMVTIGGVSYPILHIGDQYWLGRNLDYKWNGLPITGGGYTGEPKACYPDLDETTYGQQGNKYGLLYNYYAAVYLDEHKDTLLPPGWRVATEADYTTLFTTCGGTSVAGKKLKSTSGWKDNGNGTDDYDFGIVPAGEFFNESYQIGQAAYMIAPDRYGSFNYYFAYFSYNQDKVSVSNMNMSDRGSLRLVYDPTEE